MKSTRVIHDREMVGKNREGDTYSFGHLRAVRDPKLGISLSMSTSPGISSSTPYMSDQEAIHAADCLRAAVANTAGKACGGKSIIELMWEELDRIVDRILSGAESEDGLDRGRAEGMAYAIAIFQNPYRPNIEIIREEATNRWYEENGEEESEEG